MPLPSSSCARCFVTGAAGFIGSNLTDRLLALGREVVGFDNFSTGQDRFLESARQHPSFRLIRGDLLDLEQLTEAMGGCDMVFHLAANADVRFGTEHPRRDLDQNTIATWNVLEAMRRQNIRRIAFSSTGSVYGEAGVIPTPEDCPFPVQTSLYGASKLAAEGMIAAYCEGFGMQGYVFRFVSILGERYSHGHVFDFYKQLLEHPDHLKVLGNGRQRKSYLYVQDCVDAILCAVDHAPGRFNVLNLGTDEYCEVNQSIGWICECLGLAPRLEYTGGDRGWIGDNPFIFLECSRMRKLGWAPSKNIRQAVVRTVEYLVENRWLLDCRS
ncbi:MAG TPA: NAD-dependent epimerase/dehydratase family protein [Bryobacteraceae bacterium]|nr:NAD-dependent epimerase/dehydratase family protein [Bryobacteraceae bacterium]